MAGGTFQGDLFGPWEPGKSFPARIEPAFGAFKISLEDGRSLELPYERIKLSRGGFDGLGVVIEGAAVSGEALYIQLQSDVFLHELETNGPSELRGAARQLLAEGKSTRQSWFFSHALLVVLILGLLALIFGGISLLSERAVNYVPYSVESSLGELTAKSIMNGRKSLTTGPIYDSVKKVWERTLNGVASPPFTFHLYVADSSMVNALAAPGGHVVVFTGLLEKLESPEELAGILAHEMQHALKRHGLKGMIKSAGLMVSLSLLLGDTGMLGDIFKNFGGELLKMSYSREAEREADRGAVDILVNARIDPTKFPAFFGRVSSGSAALEHALAIVSTHPSGTERMAYLNQLFAGLMSSSYQPIDVDWTLVKKTLKDFPPPLDAGF